MKKVFEPGDTVRIVNPNLGCHGEQGKIEQRNPLGNGMYSYEITLESGYEIEVDGASIDVA